MFSFSTRSLFSVLPVFLLHSCLVDAFAQCYYPDGSIPTDYLWEPCLGSGPGVKFSSCCVPSEGDICQDNGLCYYPLSSDSGGSLYRGTCTDRTWNDPACNANICVSGFESTWIWVAKCDAGGSETNVCGSISDGLHTTQTCASGATTNMASVRTTRTTTSAGRYTAPSSVDPALYSVYTSTYTTEMTAKFQTTTKTSTFESTFTSAIGKAAVTRTGRAGTATGTSSGSTTEETAAAGTGDGHRKNKGIILSAGVLIAIVVGPLLAIAISVGIFLFLRKKRASTKGESIRLNSAGGNPPPPPPNGPVGADQIHPYEVDVNEASGPKIDYYGYKAPKVETHEIDDRTATMRSEKVRNEQLAGEKWNRATELGVQGHETVTSPSPAYVESVMPFAFEMDGTSSPRVGGRG